VVLESVFKKILWSQCVLTLLRISLIVSIISIRISKKNIIVSNMSIIVGIISILIHGSAPLNKQEILGMPTMY